jgi:hypothetical protein
VTLEDRMTRLGIATKHRQVFERYLGFLVQDGLLQPVGAGWKVQRAARLGDPRSSGSRFSRGIHGCSRSSRWCGGAVANWRACCRTRSTR